LDFKLILRQKFFIRISRLNLLNSRLRYLTLNRRRILAVGREADFAIVTLPDITPKESVALQTILHTKEATTYIDGERILLPTSTL